METKKVKKVMNLKENDRQFEIKKLLMRSSDCIFNFSGAYKVENGSIVSVPRGSEDAEYHLYVDMETGRFVKVPINYCKIFEETNRIVSTNVIQSNTNPGLSKKIEKRKIRAKAFVKTISSDR